MTSSYVWFVSQTRVALKLAVAAKSIYVHLSDSPPLQVLTCASAVVRRGKIKTESQRISRIWVKIYDFDNYGTCVVKVLKDLIVTKWLIFFSGVFPLVEVLHSGLQVMTPLFELSQNASEGHLFSFMWYMILWQRPFETNATQGMVIEFNRWYSWRWIVTD